MDLSFEDNRAIKNLNNLWDIHTPTNKTSSPNGNKDHSRSSIHVLKWIDYTQKYGFACIFSTGSSAMIYNDLTQLIFSPNNE